MYTSRLRVLQLNRPRRGGSIIVVIAFYAIAITMMGVWIRSALVHHRQVSRWHERTQAVWLAEAGVRRAAARLARDDGYQGERWDIPAAEIGGQGAAEVIILVEPLESGDKLAENLGRPSQRRLRISATATYPLGSRSKNQFTKTIEIESPTTGESLGASS